ncbi:DUF4397 domain-containing protein [Pedobacter changchengzhani]|uniref:DUF4397 domain-containing protein n=1 Tax=Pedobacter changchengzhani TaxID=2529274 RepID=A0A4R5MLL8_9SPHI|nr:DUF4397 domain-containing protein [Pedobacter changchengzhani]TDG36610.1 DUF4397 domain-containing protein [Pedobacter changchengzhani]
MKTNLKTLSTTSKLLFTLFASVLLMSACKKENDYKEITIAGLGFVHASPGTGALDLIVDNQKVTNKIFTYTNDLGYFGAFPGGRLIGIAKKDSVKYLATLPVNLAEGTFYSAFIIGVLPKPEILLVQDDLKAPETGKAKIRFINLSPDAPALDLDIMGQSTTLFNGKAFKDVSPFISIDPSASYTFEIKEGTNVTATLPATKIEAGKIYTLWAKGLKSTTDSTKFGLSILTHK